MKWIVKNDFFIVIIIIFFCCQCCVIGCLNLMFFRKSEN